MSLAENSAFLKWTSQMSDDLKKKYVPSDYMDDELVPLLKDTPDAWIIQLEDGTFALKAAFPDEAKPLPGRHLKDGDIVNFQWYATLSQGKVTKTLDDDDNIILAQTVEKPDAPAEGIVLVWEPGDSGTVTDDLDYINNDMSLGETVTIEYVFWSQSLPFTFRSSSFHPAVDEGATNG
jgi:hypothetical protein